MNKPQIKTGIVKDRRYLEHDMGPFHVESPQRLEAIYTLLENETPFPLEEIVPRSAEENEIAWIHTENYIRTVKATKGKERVMLDPDTSTSPKSYETALLAAGGVLTAVDRVMDGTINNGFALIRPPGHHAEASRAMGFCLFNNIAIAAEYLKRKYRLGRIFIFDWDLHHGNGTQHSFYDRSDVFYASAHQFPFYPGTGHWRETGEGKGEGFTLNVPLLPGKGDQDYLFILHHIIAPVLDLYKPDFILVSAGFDIYAGDPLGGMEVSTKGFGALTQRLMDAAAHACDSRLLIILEGGYDYPGQAAGVKEVLKHLSGRSGKEEIRPDSSVYLDRELAPVFKSSRRYWDI